MKNLFSVFIKEFSLAWTSRNLSGLEGVEGGLGRRKDFLPNGQLKVLDILE
jgi:hypothetical protein